MSLLLILGTVTITSCDTFQGSTEAAECMEQLLKLTRENTGR